MNSKECQIVIVVGDRFASFGSGGGVITLSQLLDVLEARDGHGLVEEIHYIPGQGLSTGAIELIACRARTQGWEEWFRAWELRAERPKAGVTLSHKVQAQNVLISVPRRTGVECYEVDLDIDDESELMLDHSTGQHVQGMVLIEACRQTFLSVTQKFYLEDRAEKYYFVINDMDTRYNAFVFPIEAKITYAILESDLSKPGKLKFRAHMAVVQNGTVATEVTVRFTAFAYDMLSSKEEQLAQQCVADAQLALTRRFSTGQVSQSFGTVDVAYG